MRQVGTLPAPSLRRLSWPPVASTVRRRRKALALSARSGVSALRTRRLDATGFPSTRIRRPAEAGPSRFASSCCPRLGRTRPSDAIVYLAGGPGQAATELIGDAFADSGGVRQHRDVIYADQRGTGGLSRFSCQFYGPPDNPQTYFDAFLPIEKGQGLPRESGAGRRSGPIHDERFGRRSRGDSHRARLPAADARRRLLRHTPGDGVRAALRAARPRRRPRRSGHAGDACSRTLRAVRGTRARWAAR